MSRAFKFEPATRTSLPLLLGIVGPSGSGKTFSALRVATGIAKVRGGKVFVVDSESNRSLWYADDFDFLQCDFKPPFGPLEYLAAVQQAHQAGASVVVIDSMSHEHEGPGGVLEMHDTIAQELMKKWNARSLESVTFPAWAKPKQERRRFINTILQLPISVIMCFRAKEKMRMPKRGAKDENGKDEKATEMGWQPIGGEDIFFELGACFLLRPGAEGMPSFTAEHAGERAVIKTPKPFLPFLSPPRLLDEKLGEEMALWTRGANLEAGRAIPEAAATEPAAAILIAEYHAALDTGDVGRIDADFKAATLLLPSDKARVQISRSEALARFKKGRGE